MVHGAMCSVQCAACSVQCEYAVCSVSMQCAVCMVQCAWCSVQCAVFTVALVYNNAVRELVRIKSRTKSRGADFLIEMFFGTTCVVRNNMTYMRHNDEFTYKYIYKEFV